MIPSHSYVENPALRKVHSGSVPYTAVAVVLLLASFLATRPTLGQAAGPEELVGSWAGSWTNFTFGSTGTATADVSLDEESQIVSAVIDLDGNVFGGPDPDPIAIDGTYSADQPLTLTGSTDLGDVTLTLEEGVANGQIEEPPSANIDSVDLTGTYDAKSISLDYTITFADESQATGLLVLDKEVEMPADGTVHYVDADATGSADGTSWADAFTSLQDALSAAEAGDDIWIAAGTYYPDEGTDVTDDDRAASFTIAGTQDGVGLYGGFDGSETARDQRDPAANETVLSGDIGMQPDSTDNSYHVVVVEGTEAPITNATVIDGLIVLNGQADGSGYDSYGGGLFCDGAGAGSECSPTIATVIFRDNVANFGGGALYNGGSDGGSSSPRLTNVIFRSNVAHFGGGGAVYNDASYLSAAGANSPHFTNVLFVGNRAGAGRVWAVYHTGASGESRLRIANVVFLNNTGALYNEGGRATLVNSILWNNGDTPISNTGADAALAISYSIVQNGMAAISSSQGASASYDAATNFDADPLFVNLADLDGPDGLLPSLDDGLRLRPGSPALDAGNSGAVPAGVDEDLAGAPRVQNGAVDIGAYEGALDRSAQLIFVDDDATGADDGTSWADAYTNLHDALAAALPVDVIVAAGGIYYPDEGGVATDDDRSASFEIAGALDGLRIYGGYAGDETLTLNDLRLDAREPTAHETVLSGDIDQNDGPFAPNTDSDDDANTPTQTDHLNGANSYHVLFLDGTSAPITGATIMDGLVITGGQANADLPDNSGAGLFCNGASTGGGCSPTLSGLTFRGNAADQFGGAILNDNASPLIADGMFAGNWSGFGGGAVANDGTVNAVSSPVISGNHFENNRAGSRGGAIWNSGTDNGTSNPQIVGNAFVGNAASAGGAIFSAAGEDGTSSPQIVNNRFIGNSGSAVYNNPESGGTVDPLIAGSVFSGNVGTDGGAIFNARSAGPTIINSSFSGNRATGSFFGPTGDGGAVFNDTGTLVIANSIFFGNIGADEQGGDEGADQIHSGFATVSISYSLIEGSGGSGDDWNTSLGADDGGNLDADPLFADADGADDSTGTADDDLRLQSESPAIDAGDNAAVPPDASDLDGDGDLGEPLPFDLDGTSRFQDVPDVDDTGTGESPIVDMGAYEAEGDAVSIDDQVATVRAFDVGAAYPNPARAEAHIPYDVKETTHVRLTAYDLLGRRVATLIDEIHAPGSYEASFKIRTLPAGIYVYRISMSDFQATGTVIRVR